MDARLLDNTNTKGTQHVPNPPRYSVLPSVRTRDLPSIREVDLFQP
jgi:hypothetical protein